MYSEIEKQRIVEFTGEMSDRIIQKKMSLLSEQQEKLEEHIQEITSQIYDFEEELLYIKYKNKTIQDIAEMWDKSKHNKRMDMLMEIPALREKMGEFEEELGGDAIEIALQIAPNKWDETSGYYVNDVGGYFEIYCKKESRR